jgi:hypothetical protein
VLHGVASVVTDLTREPRRGSPGSGWWFRLRLAAEKRKKKFGELGFLENFSVGFRNVLAYICFFFFSFFRRSEVLCFSQKRREHREKRENRMKREKISVRNELQKKLENLYLVAP